MSIRRPSAWTLLCALATVSACGGSDSTNPNQTAASISAFSGNGQSGTPGAALSSPIVAIVTAAGSVPVKGTTVLFTVTSGSATVSPSSTTTDVAGHAQATVTLGASATSVQVTASVAGTSLSTVFSLSGSTTNSTASCSTSQPTTFTAGQISAGVSGTGICIAGGASSADYALIGFYANPTNTATTSFSVQTHGATALSSTNTFPSRGLTSFSISNATPLLDARAAALTRFAESAEMQRHLAEQRVLRPKVAAARAAFAARQTRLPLSAQAARSAFAPNRNNIPSNPTVGQIITLNGNGGETDADLCTTPINKGARIVAVSNTAIVAVDTTNPTAGPTFSDAEYAAYATTFDTLVNGLDTLNFGTPTDIDGNHRILMFFTREVNALTPRGSPGQIGGFFDARDLFPQTTQVVGGDTLDACPTSNVGEMFYLLVPDSTGQVTGANPVTKTFVVQNTIGTLAHEYQHLINASRRLYINTSADFPEEVWLNEGLSHMAEELLFYRTSGLTPRQNLDITALTPQPGQNDFFQYQIENMERYLEFLNQPTHTSPFAENDSLQTRGATWNLLRYLLDHTATASDATTLHALVNSNTSGQANLAGVFGGTYMTQIRDWATSVFTDDDVNSAATFQQPSWNMRDIFNGLSEDGGQTAVGFQLAILPIGDTSSPTTVNLIAGATAYMRFTVPANTNASIDWSAVGGGAPSAFMQFTLVRTR